MTAVFDEHRRLVAPLAERFAEAGFRLYLVGGAVRDSLLAARSDSGPAERVVGADMDLTTDATPDQTKSLVGAIADAVWLQGQRFGTIGARISGTTVEITTHRAEVYVSDSRKPVVAYCHRRIGPCFSEMLPDPLQRQPLALNQKLNAIAPLGLQS